METAWIEKYRPKNIDDIISHNENITTIKKMIENKSLPHLLFRGSPGTGKTSTIMAIANELYGSYVGLMVLKMDASDDRGINAVRDEIKSFAQKSNMFFKGIRLIILDEADAMTVDAQFALRRIIEKYSNLVRFCLICNYENKIIPAIRSRCASFHFSSIDNKSMIIKLRQICDNEKLDFNDNILMSIARISRGDLRRAINILHTLSMASCSVYDVMGLPDDNDIKNIIDILISKKKIKSKYEEIMEIITDNGYSLSAIINELIYRLVTIEYNPMIYSKLADLEVMTGKGVNNEVYLSALVCIFN